MNNIAKDNLFFGNPLSSEENAKVDGLLEGIQRKEIASLAKAITLVESTNLRHKLLSNELQRRLLPLRKKNEGNCYRIGISGVPGVGKSTFLENFGLHLCEENLSVAVLAIDPTSPTRGGSILGDKTRMQKLSVHKNAFIRPSPAGKTLGGVAEKTRETLYLCEAFGFDVVCIETVGVGQSEVHVADICDVFCVLMLATAGDELQGIKKGILELANFVLINKCDSELTSNINRAVGDYTNALKVVHSSSESFSSAFVFPKVLKVSGQTGLGIAEFWGSLKEYKEKRESTGAWQSNRVSQLAGWLRRSLESQILQNFWSNKDVLGMFAHQFQLLQEFETFGSQAAENILAILYGKKDSLVAEPKNIDKD